MALKINIECYNWVGVRLSDGYVFILLVVHFCYVCMMLCCDKHVYLYLQRVTKVDVHHVFRLGNLLSKYYKYYLPMKHNVP